MANSESVQALRRFEIPGRISIMEGNGDLPKVEITGDAARAEVYLHGAHVTGFQQNGQPPLLFMSQCSRFANNQPIRGGVPLILPWFGPREGEPAHGFARTTDWHLTETSALPAGGATLRFSLPETTAGAMWPAFTATFVVTVTDHLAMELIVTNAERDRSFTFENCLHTYFQVADIAQVSVVGLKGAGYLDKADNYTPKTEQADAITFAGEVDRTYMDTAGPVEILDRSLRRKILVAKTGSHSTVVWNPWIAKAAQMPDFGNDEYKQMVCVESGNVGRNKITLAPGQSCAMRVELSATPL